MGFISWLKDKTGNVVDALTNIDDSSGKDTFVNLFEDDIGPQSDHSIVLDDVECECD